jgi:peptide/nickel transport system substrate-binding protein
LRSAGIVGAGRSVRALVPGRELVLRAFPGYQRGPAATPSIRFAIVPDATALADRLRSGTIDWAPRFDVGGAGESGPIADLDGIPGLRITRIPSTAYLSLAFNVRTGRLFADVRLRQALERCIDKPAIVEAATGGAGIPIYGPILPSSWAYQMLPAVTRDVAAARALIESAGWTAGADGIFTLKGRRLAAEIPVRDNRPDRVKFAELVALQARDCGFDLTARPVAFGDLINMLWNYPHVIPGGTEPFDLYLAGWTVTIDPAEALVYFDLVCLVTRRAGCGELEDLDPEIDRLLDEGAASYDQAGGPHLRGR